MGEVTMAPARQLSIPSSREAPADRVGAVGAKHGEILTRRWVVELILDLVGYTSDRDLAGKLVVEPSCGSGAFLLAIVDDDASGSQRRPWCYV